MKIRLDTEGVLSLSLFLLGLSILSIFLSSLSYCVGVFKLTALLLLTECICLFTSSLINCVSFSSFSCFIVWVFLS